MSIKVNCDHVAFPSTGPFAVPNGTRDLALTWNDIVWAGITVGRRNWREVRKHGVHSWFEMIYRAGMLWANLRVQPGNRLTRSSAYDALDQSEKGAISYFLGMTLSKAFADKALGVPWLVHMSTFTNGRHLSPDLIGFRRGAARREWVVIESKGRTGGLPAKLVAAAVQQAKSVPNLSWNGAPLTPALSLAAITYFRRHQLRMHIEDPETDPSGEPVEVSEGQLLSAYYEPVQSLLEAGRFERRQRAWNGRNFVMASIPELDLEVGVLGGLPQALTAGNVSDALGLAAEAGREIGSGGDGVAVHQDGIAVALGPRWADRRMQLEPSER